MLLRSLRMVMSVTMLSFPYAPPSVLALRMRLQTSATPATDVPEIKTSWASIDVKDKEGKGHGKRGGKGGVGAGRLLIAALEWAAHVASGGK